MPSLRLIAPAVCALPLLLAVSVPVAAQSCHAENDGPGFNNGVSMGGPNLLLAIKFTAPASLTVSGAEIFTGEGSGTNSLSIWTHVATGNLPGSSLGTGSWAMSSVNSWQGTTITPPVALAGGTTYWLVWGCVNGSQTSVDNPGSTAVIQQYRGSFNGGVSWNGPFSFADRPWKFRLSCSSGPYQTNQACASLDAGGVITLGATPAVTTLAVGQPTTVSFGGNNGSPWDLLYTLNTTLVPSFFTTPNGQILNVDFTHPSAGFLLGGGFTNSFAPFSVAVSLGTPATEIDGQSILIDFTHPDGFCFSQGSAIRTL